MIVFIQGDKIPAIQWDLSTIQLHLDQKSTV